MLLDTENSPDENQSPIRLEDTPPPTAALPLKKSSMSVKEKTRSFLGLVHGRIAESDISGTTTDQTETYPLPSVTSPTIPFSRDSLAKVIIPTKKARVQPYTADPQPRHSFWGDEKLLSFEPVTDLKPLSQAQAFAV
jgi:hypothetical protein